jgi:hypothetical protein
MNVTPVRTKKTSARRKADSPATRRENLTRFWRVVRRHPTIPDDAQEVRACVVDTLVGDLTLPEGTRLERDTPLYLRVASPAALRTAVPPDTCSACEQELALPAEELTRRPVGLYLREAGVYLTLLYPGLHDCGIGLDNELLARAFCAVLRTGRWRVGLDVLLEPVRQTAAVARPTKAMARAAADLWEARPAERGPRRLNRMGARAAPAITLVPLATPDLHPQAAPHGPVIAISLEECPTEALCLAAAALQFRAYYGRVGQQRQGRTRAFEDHLARYSAWWDWFVVQPPDQNGIDRFVTRVYAGKVAQEIVWPTTENGIERGVLRAQAWLGRALLALTPHEVIRFVS